VTRWIGIDYGTKNIGVAIADPGGSIASPATALRASGSAPSDARLILRWALDNEPGGVVVGLPMNMDGSEGPQAKLSRALAAELEKQGTLPVCLWDERLTSFQADLIMETAGVRRSRRKGLRDALAAQVILQSFLDANRPEAAPPGDAPPDDEDGIGNGR
jgi:putative holliday junction resolvase